MQCSNALHNHAVNNVPNNASNYVPCNYAPNDVPIDAPTNESNIIFNDVANDELIIFFLMKYLMIFRIKCIITHQQMLQS